MKGETWDFGDTFSASDSQSVYSKENSGGLLVKFSEINIISHNPSRRNIDDHLKTIRE